MKSKQTRPRTTAKFSFIELESHTTQRKITLPAKRSPKAVADMLKAEYKKVPTAVMNYLVLSAANTRVPPKGWLNAINCRNIFPEGPNIDFIPQESFGGKVEIWLDNVVEGDSFVIQFRVVCGYNGNWKISSSETAQFLTPINPVSQSIDFFIPPVDANYGMVLIALEPLFASYGSWVFNDVIINKVEF